MKQVKDNFYLYVFVLSKFTTVSIHCSLNINLIIVSSKGKLMLIHLKIRLPKNPPFYNSLNSLN